MILVKGKWVRVAGLGLALLGAGCTNEQQPQVTPEVLQGQWITAADQKGMLDPQTSGLIHWQGELLSISDGSAHKSQRLRLHRINSDTGRLSDNPMLISMSESVSQSCFADHLAVRPDLEALVAVPGTEDEFVTVTEDASRTPMSEECEVRFADSGSTRFPSVLVRLKKQQNGELLMTHVRALQFAEHFEIGDFPNDGVEGMAFDNDNTLYVAMEKDKAGQPRIFSVKIDQDFWSTEDFARLADPQLATPLFESGNHPINGMDFYPGTPTQTGFLFAAARNDDQLWIIDLDKKRPTKIVHLAFEAPAQHPQCQPWQLMDNASIEGLAVVDNTIWMVNDPWKAHYMDNLQCEQNRDNYQRMAPLLFNMPLNPEWVK